MSNLPDVKALKKLTLACRKLGIKTFKTSEFEFTLTDDAPESNYKKSKSKIVDEPIDSRDPVFSTDSLTPEQLLNWSVLDPSLDESSNEDTQ